MLICVHEYRHIIQIYEDLRPKGPIYNLIAKVHICLKLKCRSQTHRVCLAMSMRIYALVFSHVSRSASCGGGHFLVIMRVMEAPHMGERVLLGLARVQSCLHAYVQASEPQGLTCPYVCMQIIVNPIIYARNMILQAMCLTRVYIYIYIHTYIHMSMHLYIQGPTSIFRSHHICIVVPDRC